MACITFSRNLSKKHIDAIRKLRPLEMFIEKKSGETDVTNKDNFRLECQKQFRKMAPKKRLKFIRKAVDAWEKYVTEENLTGISTLHHLLNRKDIMFLFKSLGSKEIFRSAYQIFVEEKLNEITDMNTREKFVQISQMWKNLNLSEKNEIKSRLEKENEDRKKQQASFVNSLSKPLKFEYDIILQEKQNRKNGNNFALTNESNGFVDNILTSNGQKGEPKSKAFELFRNKNNLEDDLETLTRWTELRKKKKLKFINKAIRAGEQDEISLFEILTTDDMEVLVSSLNIPDNLLNKTHGSHLFIRERDIDDLTLASLLWDRLTTEKKQYFESKADEANEQRKAQLDQILANFTPKHRSELEAFISNRHKQSNDQNITPDFILVYHNGRLSPPVLIKNNCTNGMQSRLSRGDLTHISRLLTDKLKPERDGFLRRINGSSRERFLKVEENLKQLQMEMSYDALQFTKKRIHSPSSMSTISVEPKKLKQEKSTESLDSQPPF